MAKFDFKKEYKDLYMPKEKVVEVLVPKMQFIMIDGQGDPNSTDFQVAVEALYGIAFTIKMMPKKRVEPEGYFEYVVPPLEGLWGIKEGAQFSFDAREHWRWTLMIRQPDFVTPALVSKVKEDVQRKKGNDRVGDVRLEPFTEGHCIQILHVGPYSEEPLTVKRMEEYMELKGLRPTFYRGGLHHEIYLSDPRKCVPENLRTVLRQPVEKLTKN